MSTVLTGWHEVCPAPPVEAYDLILDVLVRPAGFGRSKAPLRRSSAATTAATRCRRTGRNPDAAHDRVSNQDSNPTWPPVVADHHSPLRCRCPFRDVNRRTGKLRSSGISHARASGIRCTAPSSGT